MRRFGEPRRRDVIYDRRPGAYAVIAQGSAHPGTRLMLTEQDAVDLELQLPGGGGDPGESPIRALHREVFEETGWHIRVKRRLGAYQRFTYMPEYDQWAHKICLLYLCAPTLCVGPPTEPDHRVVWMSAHEACRELTNSGDRHWLASWLGRRQYG